MDFRQMVRTTDDFLDLETPALAALLAEFFHSVIKTGGDHVVMTPRYLLKQLIPDEVGRTRKQEAILAILEAWNWLVCNGLLVPYPTAYPDQHRFSRLGEQLCTADKITDFQRRAKLPRELLHTSLQLRCWSDFLAGDHDTAVFNAFKQVEVAVRDAGGFDDSSHGQELMKDAFNPDTGRLTDHSEQSAERKALFNLFQGAYGRFRNPSAHRHGEIKDPEEAFELLVAASHLLRVVDRRKAATTPSSTASGPHRLRSTRSNYRFSSPSTRTNSRAISTNKKALDGRRQPAG